MRCCTDGLQKLSNKTARKLLLEGRLVLPTRCRMIDSTQTPSDATAQTSYKAFNKPDSLTKIYFFLFNDVLILVDSAFLDTRVESALDRFYVLPLRRLFVFDIPENYGMAVVLAVVLATATTAAVAVAD
jgi:hypothetical protein